MSGETLRIERTFQAPAQAVFDAWTSEEVLRRWFHGRARLGDPRGARSTCASAAPCASSCATPTKDVEHGGGGHYTEIDPPTRLAFTWTWDDDARETLIEIDFEEADGATTVRFTHSGLRDEESVRSHEEGWTTCFDNLERALEASR